MKLILAVFLFLIVFTSLATTQSYILNIKLHNGTTERFRVDSIKAVTFSDITSVTELRGKVQLPAVLSVLQNYPNPFNPSTRITYRLTEGSQVEVEVFSITGERVRVLESGFMQQGEHTIDWDAKNNQGGQVASGAYLYRVRGDGVVQTRKMLFVK